MILYPPKEHSLLPVQHIGAYLSMTIDNVLDFLVKRIHATWQNNDSVAMLLSLSMIFAFDHVVPAQLLHDMREKGIAE